jgi:hypothetical protein
MAAELLQHRRTARQLRWLELLLAVIGAVLAGLMGAIGKTEIAADLPVDFVALTGVITTVSGAILAYIEASRLDHLVDSYLTAADQLGDLLGARPEGEPATSSAWSSFVQQVEGVLASENGAWVLKLSQPVAAE